MTITRWTPIHDVAVLQNRLSSLLEDFAGQTIEPESSPGVSSFTPPVDIYEDAQKLTIKLEVPGIREEDLDIRLENQTLTVRGERKFEKEEKQENYHRIERRFGTFVRSFTLPNTVDTEKVQASYDSGVLSIEVTKRAEAQPKQIKVAIGKQLEGKPAA
jgi:HSP20 family protein